MAVIKLVEDYAVTQLRKDVRDSLTMAGEQCILLSLFHASDPDAVPCPECGDDVYKSPERDCPSCFGTMFDGGVRTALKVWGLFTDHTLAEQLGPRGTYEPDQRSIQFEAFPEVTEHDVVVRVRQWAADGTVAQLEGFYMLGKVDRRSLRTGSRFGQYTWDVVAQKASLSELSSSMDITKYPIVGKHFAEPTATLPTTPPALVVQPDVKVIYYPLGPATPPPGEEVPVPGQQVFWEEAMIFTQATPAATWTIAHPFDHNPTVRLIVGGEEADTDVDYPDPHTVVLTFATPQAGTAELA